MPSNNLNVISDMKQTILKALLSDESIVKLIRNTSTVTLPDMPLRYTQVVPWKAVPDTQGEAKTFVTFEVDVIGVTNCAVKDFSLNIYVITHESLMKFDNAVGTALDLPDRGVRTDILADKIDYLLNGSTDFGFGKLELKRSPTFDPIDGYHGRKLEYYVQGWNRYGEKL